MSVRPAKYRDFAGIKQIFALAFQEEYQQRGVDIVHRIRRIQALYPLVRLLACFRNPYQDLFNVHVCESEGRLAGFVQISARNRNKTRWHIDNIAVHPDFRGKGIAKEMLNAIFARYSTRGGQSYTLEVDTKNAPAISLYEKMGFRKYTTLHYFKMPEKTLAQYQERETLSVPEGLRLRRDKDARGLYELYCSAMPQMIRVVEDRTVSDFKREATGKASDWLKQKTRRSLHWHWVVEDAQRDKLVASLELHAQLRPVPHVIQLTVNPGYDHLTQPLLELALHQAAQAHISPVLMGAFDFQGAKLEAAKQAGFKKLTADFMMVRDSLKVVTLPSFSGEALIDDGVFKPIVFNK